MGILIDNGNKRKPCYLTTECKIQLQEALEFVAGYSPKKAKLMYDKFFQILDLLEMWPEVGTIYTNESRKFLLGKFPYFIYYREKETEIEVLGIWHTSRGTEFSKPRD
jgi:plasmid stabilization system protein ParE